MVNFKEYWPLSALVSKQKSLPGESICFSLQKRRRSRYGHSDVDFLFIFGNKCQKVAPVNHQQKCLIKGIFHIFDIKSNFCGPVIPKNLEKF